MFGPPRIGWKPLAQLCRRLGTALGAGVDIRRALLRESETGKPRHRHNMAQVRAAVDRGDSVTDAFASSTGYFPTFFLEMLGVGEQTGKVEYILPKLADYYDHLVQLRRVFLLGIAWPAIQFVMAIGIIGLLILALGWVESMTGEATDILGFGLVGVRGLIRYLMGLGFVFGCIVLFVRFLTHGPIAHKLMELALRLPGVGPNLQLMSLSRIAWALGLATDSGADARKSMRLALSSTANDYYRRHVNDVDLRIRRGEEMHEALRATGAFPAEFVDALEVGEQSGLVSETMLKLAESLQDRAKATMTGVTLFATILVWIIVGGILIMLIFRIFGAYLGILQEATQGF